MGASMSQIIGQKMGPICIRAIAHLCAVNNPTKTQPPDAMDDDI
jgi:hypothetical protein